MYHRPTPNRSKVPLMDHRIVFHILNVSIFCNVRREKIYLCGTFTFQWELTKKQFLPSITEEKIREIVTNKNVMILHQHFR